MLPTSPNAAAEEARLDDDADEGPAGADHTGDLGLLRGTSVRTAGLVAGLAALGLVLVASVALGSKPIPFGDALDALLHPGRAAEDGVILREYRVPRTIVGLMVGASLGMAGAVMQGVARNPLADPGILGTNAGAALAVVIGIHHFGATTLRGYIWFGFAGAAAASLVVWFLGTLGRDGANPAKLSLAGAALTAFLTSLTAGFLLADATTLDRFRFWSVGSLTGRDAELAAQAAPFVIAGAVCAVASGRLLNALALGDDVARSLGQKVGRARAFSALSVILLVGAATSVAGPIGFVGLTVPHVARSITGPDYRWVIAYSAVIGATLLLGADVVGRIVARPSEIDVGVMTALLGGPVFITLVRRRRLASL